MSDRSPSTSNGSRATTPQQQQQSLALKSPNTNDEAPQTTTVDVRNVDDDIEMTRQDRPLLADGDDEEAIMARRVEEGRRDREEANRREAKKVVFLCLDLTHLSQTTLFILLSSGVLGFFLLNSWLEEYLFKQLKEFRFGWYMTAFELMCFAGFAMVERWAKRVTETKQAQPTTTQGTIANVHNGWLTPVDSIWSHNAEFKNHLFVAFCMTCSRGLTNKSLEYLNYPTQVIFKSMKLITVMIGSLIILKQRFTILEYVSAVALVLSAILFSLGDVSTAPAVTGYTGFVIVILSLVADALHSNTQEQLLKQHKSTILEAMLYTNLFAAILSWIWVIATGEFAPASAYCQEQPIAYILFIMRAAVIYMGVLCFVLMINTFGVVKATAITTVRKILTIIVSFILFPKPISSRHVLGFLIFSAGICVSVWDQRERARQRPASPSVAISNSRTNVQKANSGGA